MKKAIQVIALFIISTSAISQVGINTTAPQALLDISSSDPMAPESSDGLLVPRVDTFPAVNPGASQNGQIIYLRTALTGYTVDTVARDYPVGFYYWNNLNTDWVKVSSDFQGWKINGNDDIISGTHFLGTTNAEEVDIRINNIKIADFTEKGQFGLNSTGRSVYIGLNAGNSDNGSQNNNVALGYHTLRFNTSGSSNTAIGTEALRLTTTGIQNTGVGHDALERNTTGSRNTAIGYDSLEDNTSGNNNTALGSEALTSNTTGNDNVAIGLNALFAATTARESVAVGESSLRTVTSGVGNTALGADTGNSITTGINNLILGRQSGQTLTTGSHNIAIGFEADITNPVINFATAIGYRAEASGEESTGIGYNSVASGLESIALGANTIASGEDSVAIGDDAEAQAEESIAIGNNARVIASRGSTAIGHENSIDGGSENSLALGHLNSITGGADNATVVGINNVVEAAAINSLIFGHNSILRGGASNSIALGNNIIIENGYTNTAGVGYQASPTQSNQIRLGNTAITNIMGQVAITTTSDKRFKTDVKNNIAGLDFITQLEPVSYTFDKVKLSKHLEEKETPINTDERIVGFMAQDVEKVAQKIGFDFSGIKKPSNDNDIYGLSYASFVVPLVKAVQEQQEEIESLKEQVSELQDLKAEVEGIKAMLLE